MDAEKYPDCMRFHPGNNSLLFVLTDEGNAVVAAHEVLLSKDAKEIGRRTFGLPERGYVRFPGEGPAMIYEGEPEEGMKLWKQTGRAVWVDVSKVKDTAPVEAPPGSTIH